jgi:hypothetical protein
MPKPTMLPRALHVYKILEKKRYSQMLREVICIFGSKTDFVLACTYKPTDINVMNTP